MEKLIAQNNPGILYNKSAYAQEHLAAESIKRFTPIISKNSNIRNLKLIDFGCADGKVLMEILQAKFNFSKVVGVDLSKEIIEYAQVRYGNERSSFRQMNIESPNVEIFETFDVANCFGVFHWVKNHKQALLNIRKFLLKGGIFNFYFFLDLSIPSYFDELKKNFPTMSESINKQDFHPPSTYDPKFKDNFENLIDECGFTIESKEIALGETFDYKVCEKFRGAYFSRLNPY